jgi:proteic killer suppression protein
MNIHFRSKALKALWQKNDASGIKPEWLKKVVIVLSTLNAANSPEEMDLPGFGFHALTGNKKGRFAVSVSRNWRVTFAFEGPDATQIDLEDCHGK